MTLSNSAAAADGRQQPNAGPRVVSPAAEEAVTVRQPSCENCGREASERRVAKNLMLCDACRRRYAVIHGGQYVAGWAASIAIFALLMPALLARYGGAGDASSTAAWVVFVAAFLVGLAVHEMAHAIVARRIGFKVVAIGFGTGPVVWRRMWRGARVTLHALPLCGMVHWMPGRAAVTPRRRALVAAAGPLANLGLAALCWCARASAPEVLIPAACVNLATFVLNALPTPYGTRTRTLPNDGWQVLMNLRPTHWARTHLRRLELGQRCGELERTDGTAAVREFLRSEIAGAHGDHPDAEAMLCVSLLASTSEPAAISEGFERSARLLWDRRAFPALRAAALNNRAYCLALGGWPERMEEAECAAREALRVLPDNTFVLGTLSLVLVRRGRLEEAEPIAADVVQQRVKAMAAASGPALVSLASALAAIRCVLGLVYAHTGRTDAAERELAQALALDSACVLLGELEGVLAGAPAPTPHLQGSVLPPSAPAQPLPAPRAETAAAAEGRRPPSRLLAAALLIETAGLVALVAVLVSTLIRGVPGAIEHGGMLRFHLDPLRVAIVFGGLGVVIAALAYTIAVIAYPPQTRSLRLSRTRRRVAQAGPALSLLLAPVTILIVVARALDGHLTAGVAAVALAALVGAAASLRVLRSGLLRLGPRELVAVTGRALLACLVPVFAAALVFPHPPARHVFWNYFWLADATKLRRTVTDVACAPGGRCAAVLALRSVSGDAQALEFTSTGGDSWSPTAALGARGPLAYGVDMACPAPGTCIVSSGDAGRVMKTIDAGASWSALPGPDVDSGLACPATEVCYGVGPTQVSVTRDGGRHWITGHELPGLASEDAVIENIACPDTRSCLAFGSDDRGALLDVTGDGGTHWVRRPVPALDTIDGLACPAARSCYAVGFAAPSAGTQRSPGLRVMRSADLGRTWTALRDLPPAYTVSTLACPTTARCVIATAADSTTAPAAAPAVFTTLDAGTTWQVRPSPGGAPGYPGQLSCADALRCAFVVRGRYDEAFVTTADGGRTWIRQATPVPF